jgi:hypothetical protein
MNGIDGGRALPTDLQLTRVLRIEKDLIPTLVRHQCLLLTLMRLHKPIRRSSASSLTGSMTAIGCRRPGIRQARVREETVVVRGQHFSDLGGSPGPRKNS